MSIGSDLVVRPLGLEDLDAVFQLIVAAQEHDIGDVEVDREDLVADWALPTIDMNRDTVGVWRGDDIVAWGELILGERAEVDVAPGSRGRGIGTWIRQWTERRAVEKGWNLVAQVVPESTVAAHDLLTADGYRIRHTAWILRIDHDTEPAPSLMPDGITMRAFRREDEHEVYRLFEDAFNEWPGRQPEAFEEWTAMATRRQDFRADLFALAVDDGEIVGGALMFLFAGEGWIDKVAVKRTHRHRGIARALLQHSFREAWHRGARVSGLSTNSRTGALSLYEKVGMTVRRAYASYAKDL